MREFPGARTEYWQAAHVYVLPSGVLSLLETNFPVADVQNLSQKINAKIGGINGVVNLKAALSHSSKEDLFMFFGADVRSNKRSLSLVLAQSAVLVGDTHHVFQGSTVHRCRRWLVRSHLQSLRCSSLRT